MNNVYHISTKEEISIKNLVYKIFNILNLNPEKIIKVTKDRTGKDMLYSLSSNKLKKELNFIPATRLNDGLKDTINWAVDNFKILKKINAIYKHKK